MRRGWLVVLVVLTACGSRAEPVPRPSDTTSPVFGVCGNAPVTVPANKIVFFSDLTDRCRVFVAPQADPVERHEANGYRVTFLHGPTDWANVLVWTQYASPPTGDERVEVDVEPTASGDTDLFGIACRSEGTRAKPGRWYTLLVALNGAYLIEFSNYGVPDPFDKTLASGIGPPLPRGRVHLRADCSGETLTLYANGNRISSAPGEPSARTGQAGLYIHEKTPGGASFVYMNMLVAKP